MPGAESRRIERDTDADWRAIGERDPFWGVLNHEAYKADKLTPAAVADFYESGREDMAAIVARLTAAAGRPPRGRALDFGCGVGRLTEAMCGHAEAVTGYDISPGMLAEARRRGGRAHYVEELPDGPFDWINSRIVLQHIAPEQGCRLIEALGQRLAPEGLISLHLTVWRAPHRREPPDRGLKWLASPVLRRLRQARLPTGVIRMYDYDLGEVVEILARHDIAPISLWPEDQDGHLGVTLYGQRADCAPHPPHSA
jgi:SAM-dependent methyltransferase